jgi:hypothetical protein
VYSDPDLAAERAAQYAQLGFMAVKFDPVWLKRTMRRSHRIFTVELDEAVAVRHAHRGKRLHLEMLDRPVH